LSAPTYEESYYRGREVWPDFRIEVRTILALARLSPDSRVLEVGCGSGELLRSLGGVARFAAGVDLNAAGLGIARGRAAVACARAEELPFGGGAFDVVVAQHLIEHLPEPGPALREWWRVLRPGGRLVLITPNADYPDPAHFEDPTHVNLFAPASLREELEKGGYRVESLFTLFPYLGRGRLGRAASIRLPSLARRLPLLAGTGRSLVAACIK
jgi:SAM-dependent methyltransferase